MLLVYDKRAPARGGIFAVAVHSLYEVAFKPQPMVDFLDEGVQRKTPEVILVPTETSLLHGVHITKLRVRELEGSASARVLCGVQVRQNNGVPIVLFSSANFTC
jgi:hypothetical protein